MRMRGLPPLAQGQVTGAVAAMMTPARAAPAKRRKTTAKAKPAVRRRKTAAKRAAPKGRLKKGSPAAKRRMAALRRMRRK